MTDDVITAVEKRLNAMMQVHGDPGRTRAVQDRIQALIMQLQRENVPYEIIAYCISQHAAACVASMKMMQLVRPELADALGEDFVEMMHRAHPGTSQLGNRQ